MLIKTRFLSFINSSFVFRWKLKTSVIWAKSSQLLRNLIPLRCYVTHCAISIFTSFLQLIQENVKFDQEMFPFQKSGLCPSMEFLFLLWNRSKVLSSNWRNVFQNGLKVCLDNWILKNRDDFLQRRFLTFSEVNFKDTFHLKTTSKWWW